MTDAVRQKPHHPLPSRKGSVSTAPSGPRRYARFFPLRADLPFPDPGPSPMLRFKASIRSTTLPPEGRSASFATTLCPFIFSCTSSFSAVP